MVRIRRIIDLGTVNAGKVERAIEKAAVHAEIEEYIYIGSARKKCV